MTSDLAVLGFAVAILILGLIDHGIWFDRCMGAALVFGGVYFFLINLGVLPRFRGKPTVIPYTVLGIFLIVEGVALGVFHARF